MAAALIAAAGLAVFANSLSIPFVFDDQVTIVDNPHVRQLWPLSSALSAPPENPVAGRPLAALSFAVNYALGGLDPRGYHAVNLAVHVSAALLLFGIVRRTLVRPAIPPPIGAAADRLAFVCALAWLIHPLQTEVVDYVTQRTESLMGLFYLLTLYAAIRAMAGDGRAGRWTGAAIAASALGMACKEPMVTAPVMVLLYDAVFCAGSVGGALRARRALYTGLSATWIVLAMLVAPGPRSYSAGFSTAVSPATYLMNQAVMVVSYLRLTVWPRHLVLDYGPTLPVRLPDILPYALLVVALMTITLAAWRKRAAVAFLGTWFFVTLAPSSSLVPIETEVGAERRMYLPLAALVVLGAVGGFALVQKLTRERPGWGGRIAAVLCVAIGLTLSVLTHNRNEEYHDPEGLWRTVLARRPHGRAHHNLGIILKSQGRREEAVAQYRAATDHPQAFYALGFELEADGQYDEAIAAYRRFIELRPNDRNVPRAYILIGRALAAKSSLPEAIDAFQQALRMRPDEVAAHGGLAEAFLQQERYADAAREFRAYLQRLPDDVDARVNLGLALGGQGLDAEAVIELERAVALAPARPMLRLGLGNALVAAGRVDEGVAQYTEGLKLAPDSVPLHNVLGLALARQGKFGEALARFERSLDIDPANPMTRADYDELVRALGGAENAARLKAGRAR